MQVVRGYRKTMSGYYYKGKEFDALTINLNNHVEHIRYLTQIDLRIFSGYVTLQLVFAGWLTKNPVTDIVFQIGLFLIDVTLSIIIGFVLYYNYVRREEIVETLENINMALGFNVEGAYIEGKIINAKKKVRTSKGFEPWVWFYLAGITAIILGVSLVLFKP